MYNIIIIRIHKHDVILYCVNYILHINNIEINIVIIHY